MDKSLKATEAMSEDSYGLGDYEPEDYGLEPHVWHFVNEFAASLREQLKKDEERWGDTWLHRTREGQEERTFQGMVNRMDQFRHGESPINWLQIAGDALICWVREVYPELSPYWQKQDA